MMKETFYFSHDYNARSDEKIKLLLRKHGYLGYGIYWAIIEDLYQNNNRLEADYDLIAYDLRNDSSVIKSIINDFDLFVVSDGFFGSLSIEKRLDERNEKSKKATENANKRWGNKVLHAQECIFYVLRFFGNNEEFIKCGITTESVSRRYSGKTGVYNYEILFQKELSVTDGIELERSIRSIAKNYTPNIKIAGYNECYEIDYQYDILNFTMQCESNGNAKIENGNAIKEKKEKEKKVKESKGEDMPHQPFSQIPVKPTDFSYQQTIDEFIISQAWMEGLAIAFKKDYEFIKSDSLDFLKNLNDKGQFPRDIFDTKRFYYNSLQKKVMETKTRSKREGTLV